LPPYLLSCKVGRKRIHMNSRCRLPATPYIIKTFASDLGGLHFTATPCICISLDYQLARRVKYRPFTVHENLVGSRSVYGWK
jgi:hypothetical protein